MSMHEKTHKAIKVPEFPDVTFREFESPSDLDALDELDENNSDFFGERGGIHVSEFRGRIEKKLAGEDTDERFYGGWIDGRLIGVANISEYDEGRVEIAGAIDQDYVRKGLGFAAGKALIEHEIDEGNTVVATVEHRNEDVIRPLLDKLDVGFSEEKRTSNGRVVFSTPPTNEAALMRRLGF